MIPCKTFTQEDLREKVAQDILSWNESKEKILNILSVPYNSSIIFIDLILKYAMLHKKVLYITDEEENINLVQLIKKHTSFREYTYIRYADTYNNYRVNLYLANHERATHLKDNFDLVIYDDTMALSRYTKYEILDLLATFHREGSRIICRSVETVFKNTRTLEMPVKDCRLPMTEPRIINTRINVNKDIPYVVYEYLNWSIMSERKVLIFVPDEERAENVYNCLTTLRETLHNNIMYFKEKSQIKTLMNFINNKRGIIIMNYSSEISIDMRDMDIMVYFADDEAFNYKKLLYICGKVGREQSVGKSEVVFLARETTKDMDTAKDMIRRFNKQAWEMGLLKI